MHWFFRSKSSSKDASDGLKKANEEMDQTARALIRTDLQLHRANERFDQQISQLHALHRVGTLINSTFDLEVILKTIAESMVKDLDFEKSGVVFLEKTGSKPLQSAYQGFTSSEYRIFLEKFEGLVTAALQHEEVFLQTAIHATDEWGKYLKSLGLVSMMLLPMRIKSRLIGFIIGGRTTVTLRLTEAQRRFYCMYASQTSTAIENARLYEALGQANLNLEERVQERTKDLIEANERLRELDTVKSNFISLVSHELRTPLTAIKGFVVTLLNFGHEISDQKRQTYLGILNEETDRLTRLITELLDIARIESGKVEMKWQRIRLTDILQRVFEALALKAGHVKIVQDFSADFPEFVADADKLEQIFMNLVVNALRFSPPDGRLTLTGRRQENGVIVEVRDEGPGIPFTHLEKIFDKFCRLDNDVNRKNPGTGLGLPICRALANLHGGKIWAESEVDQGSRFLLALPLNLDKTGLIVDPSTAPSMRQVA